MIKYKIHIHYWGTDDDGWDAWSDTKTEEFIHASKFEKRLEYLESNRVPLCIRSIRPEVIKK